MAETSSPKKTKRSTTRVAGGSISAIGDSRQSIRMTADRILVLPPEEVGERKTRGGILIPQTAASEARRAIWGEVVACGPMVRTAETGDRVLFAPDVAYEVDIRDDEYLVLRERDIHAVASDSSDGRSGVYL